MAHCGKVGFFGKVSKAGRNRRQPEKRKPNTRWVDSIKDAVGVSVQEWGGAAENRTLWTSPECAVTRSQSRLNSTWQQQYDPVGLKQFYISCLTSLLENGLSNMSPPAMSLINVSPHTYIETGDMRIVGGWFLINGIRAGSLDILPQVIVKDATIAAVYLRY